MYPYVWSCYIIVNGNSSYVGVSTNPERRLRQHNCELKGGAKYTKSKGSGWSFVCIVSGFDKISSLQFEWAIKNCKPKSKHGIKARIEKLYSVLNSPKWTLNSCEASYIPLIVQWYKSDYQLFVSCPSYVRHVKVSSSAIF